jgi:nucleoside 2-deoxyribosyltransferase
MIKNIYIAGPLFNAHERNYLELIASELEGSENAGAIIPHRSGWIFWLAGVKLHQC